MGKNSEFIKSKDLSYRYKLIELKKVLPNYTYEFLDSKAQRNPNTALAYARDLEVFFKYLKEFGPVSKDTEIKNIPEELIENLTYKDINEYQDFLDATNLSIVGVDNYQNDKNAIARRMSALRSFFKYQCERHEFENNPTIGANKQYIKRR